MDIKVATLTFGSDPQNKNHEVDIHIMTSEEKLEKLARRRLFDQHSANKQALLKSSSNI
ncbi:unnamed protein product [Mucor fragilis]